MAAKEGFTQGLTPEPADAQGASYSLSSQVIRCCTRFKRAFRKKKFIQGERGAERYIDTTGAMATKQVFTQGLNTGPADVQGATHSQRSQVIRIYTRSTKALGDK